MRLDALTRPEWIFAEVPGGDRRSVLRELSDRMAAGGAVEDADALFRGLQEREELGSTGIGSAVAVPHCKVKGLDGVALAVGICRDGVEFGAVDGEPVRVLFTVVSPPKEPAAHLQALAAISRWVRAERHVERILELRDTQQIYELLGQDGS